MQNSSSRHSPTDARQEDLRFRREILLFAQQMLHNIDTREEDLNRFQNQDHPAFLEWLSKNFGPQLERLADLEQQQATAVHFHNCMVATCKLYKVSMPQAFLRLKQEEALAQEGTASQKRSVEQERRKRENFLRLDHGREQQVPLPAVHSLAGAEESSVDESRVVYRKLARRLHPDVQGPGIDALEKRWQIKVWHTAQVARQRGDAAELQRLYKVTLLRQMEFSELTIADAHEICAYLKRELDRLTVQWERAQENPAYQFSQRRDLLDFKAQMAARLSEEIAGLEAEIKDLNGQHAYVEVLSHAEAKPQRPRRRKIEHDTSQLSLF